MVLISLVGITYGFGFRPIVVGGSLFNHCRQQCPTFNINYRVPLYPMNRHGPKYRTSVHLPFGPGSLHGPSSTIWSGNWVQLLVGLSQSLRYLSQFCVDSTGGPTRPGTQLQPATTKRRRRLRVPLQPRWQVVGWRGRSPPLQALPPQIKFWTRGMGFEVAEPEGNLLVGLDSSISEMAQGLHSALLIIILPAITHNPIISYINSIRSGLSQFLAALPHL